MRKLKDGAEERETERTGDDTLAKRAALSDSLWDGDGKDVGYVILTDSNGAGVTEDTLRRHIPRGKRCGNRIRVHTTYTLFEAFEKMRDGKIKVEGSRLVIDVATNDVRGTRGQPRTTPEEFVEKVGKVVSIAKEKGVKGVVVCEVKPMRIMDVTPFSKLLHQRCTANKIGWCQTQIGVRNLKEDGYHILPSFLQVLDATYACAVLGVPVPHPTPTHQKWRYPLPLMQQEWPRVGERLGPNVWRRREEERRAGTDIRE